MFEKKKISYIYKYIVIYKDKHVFGELYNLTHSCKKKKRNFISILY